MSLIFRLGEVSREVPLVITCQFSVVLNDVVIWPVRGLDDASVEIQIDDLLSHLSEFWKPLLLRQTYPLQLNVARPTQLRAKAEADWASTPEEQAEAEDWDLEQFQNCHDISRSFAGYFDLPSLWILRSGNSMLIDTPEQLEQVSYDDAVQALEALGDWIADRLGGEHWSALVNAWRQRNQGDSADLLRWVTSLEESIVTSLLDDNLLTAPANVAEAANDNDEIRLAARMASALPPDELKALLVRIKTLPHREAPKLAMLSSDVQAHFIERLLNARPFEQGEGVASFVREAFNIADRELFDVFNVVDSLGISIYAEPAEPTSLDALAIWGNKHGPATIINTASRRHAGPGPDNAERKGQVRVTLAHELCHFLLDGGHALGAVEVLSSKMPLTIEQRARAFAAELLLPSRVAGDLWAEGGMPRDIERVTSLIDRLCDQFSLSKSVASWKLEHGARHYRVNLAPLLNAIVPGR